ncbi:hypothetical protein BH11ARM2_BH11ARM2_21560 [soil metagenome]
MTVKEANVDLEYTYGREDESLVVVPLLPTFNRAD